LGSALLCTTNNGQSMKKMNWFCENRVPFEWKYWMTLCAIRIQFNSNANEEKWHVNLYNKYWKYACNYNGVQTKKKPLNKYVWKYFSYFFLFWNWLNKFFIWNGPKNDSFKRTTYET
jgi:hypothetical protein